MDGIIRNWAGRDRVFRLRLGDVLDLEEALGRQPISVTFRRLATAEFGVMDVHETLRIGLIGGGESILDAKRLMDSHFERRGLMEQAGIAGDLLISIMTGVEVAEGAPDQDQPEAMKFSEISQICTTFALSPQELREMRYADYVNMVRGWNAAPAGQSGAASHRRRVHRDSEQVRA